MCPCAINFCCPSNKYRLRRLHTCVRWFFQKQLGFGPVQLYLINWGEWQACKWGQLQRGTHDRYHSTWVLSDSGASSLSWTELESSNLSDSKTLRSQPSCVAGLFLIKLFNEWINQIFICEGQALLNICTGFKGYSIGEWRDSETPERIVKGGKINLVGRRKSVIGNEELVISHLIMCQLWWRQCHDMKPAN